MKILVTGAKGMVGQNFLPLLKQKKEYKILAPSKQQLNLLDQAAVATYMQEHRPDLIIHLAARVGGIQANIKEPVKFLSENVLMSTYVIQEALAANVPKLINVASSFIYPKNPSLFP